MTEDQTEFLAWLEAGTAAGWVLGSYCASHDMPPRTPDEIDDDDDFDACYVALRLTPPEGL